MIDEKTVAMNALAAERSSHEELLAELLDKYLESLERGTPIAPEQLAAERPELADEFLALAEGLGTLHQVTQSLQDGQFAAPPMEKSRKLGDFELGPEIGRGGMGVVYEARQLSLNRRVALKVLPYAAMWNEKHVARFRNEAQAAAQLHHPHIVPVFAVDQQRGVHFYAMQLINGRSLAELVQELQQLKDPQSIGSKWRAENGSTLVPQSTHDSEAAVELTDTYSRNSNEYFRSVARMGIQAAEAVHHAHECGVVHRDIKPSNLLLDCDGKLWVTDFGLALVHNSPGVTVTGDVVGTLRYMSPEQATGQRALVDHRSDIYALGATLYEMLARQPAFPGEDRGKLLKAIEQKEPAALRSIDGEIPTDLETIVLQAMSKSRDNRYATARDFAEDLDRFLQGKPTKARRPTLLDRGGKLLKRHRLAAVTVLAAMLLLTVVSMAGVFVLSRETAAKNQALQIAEENLNQARLVVDRFGVHFSRELERLPGSGPLRQQLLQDTLSYYKQFIENSASDAQLELDAAAVAYKAAGIAARLGKSDEAQQLFQRSLAAYAAADESASTEGEYSAQRVACLNELGLLEAARGKLELASDHLQAAIKLAKQEAATEVRMNLGLLQHRMGQSHLAEANLQGVVETLKEVARETPEDQRLQRDLAIALNNLSFVQQQIDWEAARATSQEAVDLLSQLVEREPQTADAFIGDQSSLGSDLALCYNNLAAIESHLGQHERAQDLHRKAIALQEALWRQNPAVLQHRSDLAVSWNNLGQALAQEREIEQANAAFQQARDILTQLVDDYPQEVAFQSSLAGVLNNQAMSLEHAGELESAGELFQQAIQRQRLALEEAPQLVVSKENLSKHYSNYSRVLRKLQRGEEAVAIAREHLRLSPDDGQHLYLVARELALAAAALADGPGESRNDEKITNEALAILEQALAAKVRPLDKPIDAADFAALRDNHRFQLLLSQSR